MISYKITTSILGIAIFLIILILVRRGKLQEKYALTWFAIGIVVVVLGVFPVILDRIARLTGVTYAPALLFVIAVGVLLIQNLYLFIFASQNEVRIKELLQEVAVLNKLVAELQEDRMGRLEITHGKNLEDPSGSNGEKTTVIDDQNPSNKSL